MATGNESGVVTAPETEEGEYGVVSLALPLPAHRGLLTLLHNSFRKTCLRVKSRLNP